MELRIRLKPKMTQEQYEAWEKYIKAEYGMTTNKKANDRMCGGDHYRRGKIQPWDAMEDWMSPEGFQGFLLGNSMKYLARAGKKGAFKEDIQKAHHYLEKLLEAI